MIDSQKRYEIFSRDFFTCQRCGATGQEKLTLAHRIKSGVGSEEFLIKYFEAVYNISLQKKQARDILDHQFNLVTACSGRCNDSYNIFFKPNEMNELIYKIAKDLKII
jgi:5-methylcytosine-specific restriction endonuclease McrA